MTPTTLAYFIEVTLRKHKIKAVVVAFANNNDREVRVTRETVLGQVEIVVAYRLAEDVVGPLDTRISVATEIADVILADIQQNYRTKP